jgi:hypothetical protein
MHIIRSIGLALIGVLFCACVSGVFAGEFVPSDYFKVGQPAVSDKQNCTLQAPCYTLLTLQSSHDVALTDKPVEISFMDDSFVKDFLNKRGGATGPSSLKLYVLDEEETPQVIHSALGNAADISLPQLYALLQSGALEKLKADHPNYYYDYYTFLPNTQGEERLVKFSKGNTGWFFWSEPLSDNQKVSLYETTGDFRRYEVFITAAF